MSRNCVYLLQNNFVHKDHTILADAWLLNYQTYENYLLDKFHTRDLSSLNSRELILKLAKLGIKNTGVHLITEEEYNIRTSRIKELLLPKHLNAIPKSLGIEIVDPVLRELAEREAPNLRRDILTIFHMRHTTETGNEISSYIDFRDRLVCTDWTDIFEGKRAIKPSINDLTFYNQRNGVTYRNETENFQVLAKRYHMVFFCKHDFCNVTPTSSQPGLNTRRSFVVSKRYKTVIFYDHCPMVYIPAQVTYVDDK